MTMLRLAAGLLKFLAGAALALLENAVMRYTVEGEVPGPLGARHPTITPFQAFRTSDGAIIIAAGNDGLFIKTCEALGRSDMASDPDYKTNALRQKHHGRLEREIEQVLKDHTTAHWLGVLAKAGVPGGPINNIKQALEHPQIAARNMLIEVPDGSGGTLKLAGNPIKMSAFDDPKTRRPAPDHQAIWWWSCSRAPRVSTCRRCTTRAARPRSPTCWAVRCR